METARRPLSGGEQPSRRVPDAAHNFVEAARRGEPHSFNTLWTVLTAPAWLIDDVHTAYTTVKYFAVFVMTLTAFPAYALARLLAVPYAFCLLNVRTLVGLWRYATGRQTVRWPKAAEAASSTAPGPAAGELVHCAHCGVLVPRAESRSAGGRDTISPGVSGALGETLTLSFSQTAGGVSYLALDNLAFDQLIPEPASAALLAGGLGALAMRRRRQG